MATPVRTVAGTTTLDELGRAVPVQPVRTVAGPDAVDELGRPVNALQVVTVPGLTSTDDLGRPVASVPVREVAGLTTLDELGRVISVQPVYGGGGGGPTLRAAHSRVVFFGDGIGSVGAAPGEANYPTQALMRFSGRLRGSVGWNQHKSGGNLTTIDARKQYTILQQSDVVIIGTMGHNPEPEGGAILGTDPVANPLYLNRWKAIVQAVYDGCPNALVIICPTLGSTQSEPFAGAVQTAQRAFIDGLGARAELWDPVAGWNPATHCIADGTHPNQLGGNYLAGSLVTLLDTLVAPLSLAALLGTTAAPVAALDYGPSVDVDWALSGTTGTKAGTPLPAGSYPAGKRITSSLTNGAGVALALTKATVGGYDESTVVLSGTPAASNIVVMGDTANLSLTGSTPGTFWEFVTALRVDNGSGGAPVGLRTVLVVLGSLGTIGLSATQANTTADRAEPIDCAVRVPALPSFGTSGPATANPGITTRWSAVALTGRIVWSRPIVRQVELAAYAAPFNMSGDQLTAANYLTRVTRAAVSVTAVVVGDALRGDPGTWSGGAIAFAPAWYRNGVQVGTGWTYTVQAGDAGQALTFRPNPSNAFGSDNVYAIALTVT